MKTLIEVKIFGETFTVTSEDEMKYVQELAAFVDQRIRRFGEQTKPAPPAPLRVAIMAALSIADDYLKSRKQEIDEAEQLERISAKLLSRLEQSEKLDRVKAAEVSESITPRFSPFRATQE